MKRIALCICLAVLYLSSGAQPGPFPPEKMSDEEIIRMQIRDIVVWLDLDEKAEKTFVKEYTAFKGEIDAVAKKAIPQEKNMSEDEIEKALQRNFDVSGEILQIRKKYYLRFREFMKPSQIQMMYRIENEAGRRSRDLSGGPGPGGPGPGNPGGPEPGAPANTDSRFGPGGPDGRQAPPPPPRY